MTAIPEAHKGSGNAGCVLILLGAVAFVLLGGLSAQLDAVTTYPENKNVPIAAPVSQHAIEKHAEAENIQKRCDQNQHTCEMVLISYTVNQRLYLYWNACSSLVDGKIETIGNKAITAFSKPYAYWQSVIVRDKYSLLIIRGVCPQ